MNKKINIVVDSSGSMSEEDKNAVVKYLLNGISNVMELSDFHGVEFELYQWGKNSKKLGCLNNVKIEFTGRATIEGLNVLSQTIDENQPIIFISDGNFEVENINILQNMSNDIIPVFVGTDANRVLLKEVAANKVIYSVTDFMQALYEARK